MNTAAKDGNGTNTRPLFLFSEVRAIDGRDNSAGILNAVYAQLRANSPEQIISFVYSPATDKSAIVRFSGIALEHAEAGDPGALEILTRNAGELALLVRLVQQKLRMENCRIALLGGLLSGDNLYRQTVREVLSPLRAVLAPEHDALWGAAQIAWELLSDSRVS